MVVDSLFEGVFKRRLTLQWTHKVTHILNGYDPVFVIKYNVVPQLQMGEGSLIMEKFGANLDLIGICKHVEFS